LVSLTKGRAQIEGGENCALRSFMLFIQFYLDNQIKVDEMVGPIACIGGMRNAYKVLGGKSEAKRPC
jgi:hypothetical protein